MKPKMLKRIFGVVILLFTLNCILVVHAKNNNISDSDWIEMFGISIDTTEDEPPKTVLYFKPEKPETNCKYTFKITKINNGKTSFSSDDVPATIGCGSDNEIGIYIMNISPSTDGKNDLSTGISLTLESLSPIELGGKDYNVELTISYSEDGANDGAETVAFDPISHSIFEPGHEIDCSNYYTNGVIDTGKNDGSFNYNFCRVKSRYLSANGNTPISITNGKYTGDPKQFSCSFNPNDININWSSLTGDDYFVNHGYLFGESTSTIKTNYVYHYAPGGTVDGVNIGKSNDITCSVKCEEAVEVEYGPPVASKAGLCFEYKVRVTSRVSCHAFGNVTPPPQNTSYCTPRPSCITSSGKELTQAGPNEDFDSCIQNCDGGKYTKKCSDKCYAEVYGNVIPGAKANSLNDNATATLLSSHPQCNSCSNGIWADEVLVNDHVDNSKCRGYYMISGGNPIWVKGSEENTAGRWYCEKYSIWNPINEKSNFNTSSNDGFFRLVKNRQPCNDNCSWKKLKASQCPSKYINRYVPCKIIGQYDYSSSSLCGKDDIPGYIDILKYDYEENVKRYEELIDNCNARATCTETTSYYTISATYGQNGVSETTQVDFPGSGVGDFARATNNGSENSAGNKQTTLFINYPSTNKGLSGCYNKPNTLHPGNGNSEGHITDLYRTTWGFPGSWINLKTGEVSYTGNGVTTETGWKLYSGKFCLPNNARDVNTDWYDAYRSKELFSNGDSVWDNPGVIGPSAMNKEVIDKCYHYTFITNSVPNFRVSSVDYNIIAHAIDFGYFNWDIDIKCFYALHSRPFNSNPTTDEEELKCIPSEDNYRVHASDPINLFPSSDGSDITNTNDSGRLVGFNWSEYAVNTKNPDYISDPPKLMEKIQSIAKAGNTYSDDYLDYQFYLSPGNIRELRKASYSPFSDSGFDISENGIVHYKSEFIRNSKYFSNIVVPQGKNVNCNNIDKLSGGCLKLD